MREVAPAVAQLRRIGAEISEEELARLRKRLPDLGEEDFQQVARSVKRVVDKLLHKPTVKIKELAASSDSISLETAVEELFGVRPVSAATDMDRLPSPDELKLKES